MPDNIKTIVHHTGTTQEHAQTESGCERNTLRRERLKPASVSRICALNITNARCRTIDL